MTGSKGSSRRKRLSRSDWVSHALETVRTRGAGGLQVEPLAKSLGVTAGSFYWHFKDRRDLVDAVLKHWVESMTAALKEHAATSTGTPEARLLSLLHEIELQDRGRFELAMRAWAHSDSKIARAVRQLDRKRLDYVRGLFREMNFDDRQAEIRSRMMIYYQIAEAGFSMRGTPNERTEYVRLRHAVLTCR